MQSWEEFLASLRQLGGVVDLDDDTARALERFTEELRALREVTRPALVAAVIADPKTILLLGLTVRMSQEQLKNVMSHRFGTSAWSKLSRQHAHQLVDMLDEEYGLVPIIERDLKRPWDYQDILAERLAPRLRARGASERGRKLEDAVETVVARLELPHAMRTRFVGQGNQTAPCDLAIPVGDEAEIVVAIKGFDSSGSKLSDAMREIQDMARIRRPNQYVFVVVDGIGWIQRKADLRRIHTLWADGLIEGVYTTAGLDDFRQALVDAARRRGLTSGQ